VSDTPRMDSAAGHARGIVDAAIIAEGMNLERELHAANERIKRLEEAGDLMVQHFYTDEPRSEMWEKAKEEK